MSYESPPLPTAQEWLSVGVRIAEELHAGMQSRVFAATTVDDESVALKLTDADLADGAALAERMRLMETLAGGDTSSTSSLAVVDPVRLSGELVHHLGGWLVTATRFANGTRLDSANVKDARAMGQTLAVLHRQLARLPAFAIPPVAPLRTTEESDRLEGQTQDRTGWQLLHGDFSDANIICSQAGLRIFDFDDCGYGPPAYDLANSLYMVLFDSETNGRPDHYRVFRPAFLEGYGDEAVSAVSVAEIDLMIDRRVDALDRWLADLTTAPIGIRTASSAWNQTLRSFVIAHRSKDRTQGC